VAAAYEWSMDSAYNRPLTTGTNLQGGPKSGAIVS